MTMEVPSRSTRAVSTRQDVGFLTPDMLSQFDFSDKSSLTSLVWVVCGIVMGLVTIVVALRIFSRRFKMGRMFLDDGEPLPGPTLGAAGLKASSPVLIIFAALFTLVLCSVSIAGTGLRDAREPDAISAEPADNHPPPAATGAGLGQHVWNLDLSNILKEIKTCVQVCRATPGRAL